MMFRWLIALPAVFALLFAVRAVADDPRTIEIRVEGSPRFEVYYHRARSTATGALLGSFIGAGIQAGMESDKDAEKRNALSPHVSEHIWNDVFVKTLNEALQAKGFEPVWIEAKSKAKAAKAHAYLTLFADSYGFRVVDTVSALVSAYVEFDAIYTREPLKHDGNPRKELFYMTGEKQVAYEQLHAQAQTLDADVDAVLQRGARRLANKIIYNLK